MRSAVLAILLTAAGSAHATGTPEAAPLCDPVEAGLVRKLVKEEATKQGVDVKLALAIVDQESAYGARVNSDKNAHGPMQLIPGTAAMYQVKDICDPAENIRGGVAFLKDLAAEFGGNIFLILSAYNAGPGRVYDAKGIPAISETVRYVATVANAYYGFDNSLKGGSRSGASRKKAAAAQEPDATRTDASGQTWIGGSVLYVD
ncbi:lytic transglycosylase domain-containing protein [Microvirga tunisiensis]|uniref:Lytic transglycosylase domain-containing protein n=1 Tax=Microvirga tunisiensis TaxID=2108360 RepID=A0A5N7MJ15_9HYPH|nr:lytic transglycosylase domain-containing protein [Microvirga tunisiensis]MPR08852.1 lytic transglycosylase domain-containing protein [Microvirga tunisiensis]MPR27035.1 lytic transglycosylase domain-containing protein [Microvirga tunisiensis]